MTNWEGLSFKSIEDLLQLFESRIEPDCLYALDTIILKLRRDLLQKCEVICRSYGHNEAVAEVIAERTFSAYAKKGGFKVDRIKTGLSVEKAFKIYLYGIARKELVNYYRQQSRKADYTGNEKIITELPPMRPKMTEEQKVIYGVIQSLPYGHQVVYLTYKAYEKGGYNLPKKLQEEIRQHLEGIKQTTVRGYKKEANDRINQALEILEKSKAISHEKV